MADSPDDPFELSQEETQVMLGRYAGASVPELSRETGMPAGRVQAIVSRLTKLGLIGDDEPEPEPESAWPELDLNLNMEPERPAPRPIEARPAASPVEARPLAPPIEIDLDLDHAGQDLVALLDSALNLPMPSDEPPLINLTLNAPRRTPPKRPVWEEAVTPVGAREDDAAPAPMDDDRAAMEAAQAQDSREYRKLYETELHSLPLDDRVALASILTGPKLFALCFDPVPDVIAAIFENTAASIEHARLIAFHHRDSRGLDEVAAKPARVSDPLVFRRLVRNPATSEPLIRRLLSNRRLAEVYRTSLDRDVPERSRSAARSLLRVRWTSGQAEERVDLVLTTEGRVLMVLTGMTFDSRMTSILCSKAYTSIMLVQALARFPATPPMLLAHLLRQPMVKRQPQLRNTILQHPNTPSDVKRKA